MKRPKIKLSLNKETIAKLNEADMSNLEGGAAWWTEGCTDGCDPYPSVWRCTMAACTDDCNSKQVCNSIPRCKSDYCN